MVRRRENETMNKMEVLLQQFDRLYREQALDYARVVPKAKDNKEFHQRVRAALKKLK